MNILSFHFGHDSAIALIRDGVVVACQLSERIKRRKHFIGINNELLDLFLESNGITIDDIDFCALTSTQREDLYIEQDDDFRFHFRRHAEDNVPSAIETELKCLGLTATDAFLGKTPELRARRLARVIVPHAINPIFRKNATPFTFFPWMDYFSVKTPTPYDTMERIVEVAGERDVDCNGNQFGFHFPATVVIRGRSMPCYLVHHHATHAAATYYLSGMSAAAIMTADGGSGRERGGWWCHGKGSALYPIAPHFLEVGGIYAQTAKAVLRLGSSADGKMMGLAPYGTPSLYDEKLVGNGFDYEVLAKKGEFPFAEEKRYSWEQFIRECVPKLGYDVATFGDGERPLDRVNADLAASVQRIFEATLMKASSAAADLFRRRKTPVEGLCLAGGSMLNCPANTLIHDSRLFGDVFIPPFTDDSGCAIGAGLWVYHNLLEFPLVERSRVLPANPYLGNIWETKQSLAAAHASGKVRVEEGNGAAACAMDLASNKIVAWYEGRSEIGPRALGHRSILADPRIAGNWRRVNAAKQRAEWRPFAPAVLKEFASQYFEGGPRNTPYMLFNARVRGHDLPAVTHVDGTSRIQTVTAENGLFHSALTHFHKLSGCPVVMNTSLNGPGDPIVETPEQALRFITNGHADVLYVEGLRVSPLAGRAAQDKPLKSAQADPVIA
jgi:carbamoyltransferase